MTNIEQTTQNMTSGNSMKQIILFFLPLLWGNLFQQLYSLVDSIIVGKGISDQALAAVGATGTLNFLILGFVVGMTRGFGITFAQSFGKNDMAMLNAYIRAAKKLSIMFGMAFTVVCVSLLNKMLTFLNTPEDIFDDSYRYFAGVEFYSKLIGPAIKMIWKKADALVANSIGLKKLAEDFYDKKEILVIPNGADLNAFEEKDNDYKSIAYTEACHDENINLLFVSRLIERKGLQDIIPQLSEIQQQSQNIGKNIKFQIVGDGPYRETLEKLTEVHNLQDVVAFYGQKNKKELPEFYRNADIFVFPSRKEGMPNVVLEAMSYGLPILMTPCQGSDELVDGNGKVAKVYEFGKILVDMLSKPDELKTMGKRSKYLIKEAFSWEKTAEAYMALFDKIIVQKEQK